MRRSLWALAVAVGAWPLTASAGGTASASVAPASSAAAPAPAAVLAAPDTTPAIAAADALRHVRVLTAPEMEGRGALTSGLDRAAAYVAARFRGMGLTGAGDGGTFFEEVDLPLPRRAGPRTALRLGGRALALGRDFAPNLGAAAATAQAGVVFAGYGISIAGGYDDYAAIDARGQLVLCLRYAPHYDVAAGHAAEPAFSAGAALRAKVENAIRHGAAAIAIVDPPPPPPSSGGAVDPGAAIDAAPLPVGAPGATNIASFHLARAAADQVLAAAGADGVAALQDRIDDSGRPASFALPLASELAVEWQMPSIAARNVVAVLPGSDPTLRQEAVLIGAHYDHLGRGDEGNAFGSAGQIHPGADDNASGTAAMLEIAEALAAERVAPRRSILFVAFTGEERGLIGSLALAEQATRRHVVAMLNLDMVGRMRAGAVEVGGSTTAPEWEAIANAANDEKLALTFPKRVAPNSDHASFLNKAVPSLFLFTGLHGDYHRASDTWDKIDADGVARAARLARRIVVAVANRDQRLAFVAPQWTRMGAVGGTHGITVRLGVMPDYQSENGLRVSAVMAGGAGAEAGLKAGDIIDRIGEKSVGDIESYMEAMALFKVGDQTVVQIRRDGAAQSLKVKFGAASAATDPAGSKP